MQNKSLAYLGPPGTFSEEAALSYAQANPRRLEGLPTIAAVLEHTARGFADEGLVPLENSLEGGVGVTLDLLAVQEGLYIRRELVRPVHHCLLGPPGTDLDGIRTIISHTHALGQCRLFLDKHLRTVSLIPVESTAAAARMVSEMENAAAIAPGRAAVLFNLRLIAENIEDHADNVTRFIVLAGRDSEPTGRDKTSLVLSVPDGPGSLYHVLGYFARSAVNLTRIESRPARRSLGDWLFFIDCEGHRLDPKLENLFDELPRAVPFFKLLGSYPVALLPVAEPASPHPAL